MGLRIPVLLDAILEATAAEASAKARVTSLRATLEAEARRRFAAEGAAPTWNAPKLGKVRLDPPGDPAPYVADAQAFNAWVAEQYPTEVVMVLEVEGPDIAAATQALRFAGIDPRVHMETRPAWSGPFLEGLEVEEDQDRIADEPVGPVSYTVADPASGEVVPGLSATRSAGKLVVTLDRDRRTRALEDAATQAEVLIEEAREAATDTPVDGPPPGDAATSTGSEVSGMPPSPSTGSEVGPLGVPDLDEPLEDPYETETEAKAFARTAPSVIAIMGIGSREDLRRFAKAHGVPAHGTKGELAIRLSASDKTVDAITRWVEDNTTQEPTP